METLGSQLESQSQHEPLQIIQFIPKSGGAGGTEIQLQNDTIDGIFKQIGNRQTCIMCVCGPSRKGKSFLLGYMIRYLEGMEQGRKDWIGRDDKDKPLAGFKFRNGSKPETMGIWAWSRPFIVKKGEVDEVAVILVDTQGTGDEFTSSKDMSAIVGLSFLFSSVMVFNLFTDLQEDILSAMNAYIQYGTLALDEGRGSGTPFQKLMFLIRDYNNPDEYPCGAEGGKSFLEEKLKIKGGQSAEAQHVRQTIRNCFDKVDCFLMSHIGKKALRLDFKGSLSELDEDFATEMEMLITELFSWDNLTLKEVMGSRVSTQELKSLLKAYIDIFNSDEVPSPESMWQATSRISNNNVLEKATQMYHEIMADQRGDSFYLSVGLLNQAHLKAEEQALDTFKKCRKFGGPEMIAEFEGKLVTILQGAFTDIESRNRRKRTEFIDKATSEAINTFGTCVSTQFPLEEKDDTLAYEEADIRNYAAQSMSACILVFKEKLANEGDDNCVSLVKNVEGECEKFLIPYMSRNRAHRLNAEKVLASRVKKLSSEHHSKLGDSMNLLQYEESEEILRGAHDSVKIDIINSYEEQKKPGGEILCQEYLAELMERMNQNFVSLKNEHKLNLLGILAKVRGCLDACLDKYKQLLKVDVQKAKTIEELIHSHNASKATVEAQLTGNCPIDLLPSYQKELGREIEDAFTEGRRLFESLRANEEKEQQIAKKERLDGVKQQLASEVERLCSDHSSRLLGQLSQHKSEENEAVLRTAHESLKLETINEYNRLNKGDLGEDIQKQHRAKMSYRMDVTFTSLKNEHFLRIQQLRMKARECLADCRAKHKQLLQHGLQSSGTLEELTKCHENARTVAMEQLNINLLSLDSNLIAPFRVELDYEVELTHQELKVLYQSQKANKEFEEKIKKDQERTSLDWVPFSGGEYPSQAIVVGYDSGHPVLIARVNTYNVGTLVGKVFKGKAYFCDMGRDREIIISPYELLCGPSTRVSWIRCTKNAIPSSARSVGQCGESLAAYIGRVDHKGTITVGLALPSLGYCYITYGGRELKFREYEILVDNAIPNTGTIHVEMPRCSIL